MHELTKKERKLARDLISASIEKEFDTGVNQAEAILQKWKNKELSSRETFHELRDHLNDYRKYLAARYDDLSGSSYLITVSAIFRDGYLTEEDIKDFSEETKAKIKMWSKL